MNLVAIKKQTEAIPSHVLDAEQALWFEMLNPLPIKTIVDFGTGWGKSAKTLSLVCPQAKILTFDTGDYQVKNKIVKDYTDYSLKVQEYLKGSKMITFLIATSLNDWQRTIANFLRVKQVDVINLDSEWLDDKHTQREMNIWLPLLKTGGLMFVHDWFHHKSDAVRSVMQKLVRENKIKLLKEANCGVYTVGCFTKL